MSSAPLPPALWLRAVSFIYRDTDTPALREVNFEMKEGELVVVMGATGAGKTTLAKLLNRTVPAFQPGRLEGEISIGGRVLDKETVAELAGIVGLVSQDFEAQLFATNVAQEVAFGMEQMGVPPDVMIERVRESLELTGLSGFERRDPATLSGGEKQRLAIAGVLAMQPRILVFDEPTTDLDPEGKVQVFDVLAGLRSKGFTIVLIEHEIAAAERADRLVLMSEGRIVADDAPARLLPQVELLERFGVRPADLDRLANALGLKGRLVSVEGAAEILDKTPTRPHSTRGTGPSETVSPPRADQPLIRVDHITYEYASGRVALADVSLQIRQGEFLALIGRNGSGKTTLAKHLNGLLQPRSGHVLLDGQDLRGLRLDRIARDVGYVFQNPDHQIFSATAGEEVAFGLRNAGLPEGEIDQRVRDVLSQVGLGGMEDSDPFLLAKGQRERLAVASMLVLRPRLLILDEPTTGLDYPEQRRLMNMLRELHQQGLTVIIITHSPWVVGEYAERGVLMDEGRVAADAPLRELFAQEELLGRCHFKLPDITRVGLRRGAVALKLEELL